MTDERFEQLMKQALKPEIDERDVVIQKNTNNETKKKIACLYNSRNCCGCLCGCRCAAQSFWKWTSTVYRNKAGFCYKQNIICIFTLRLCIGAQFGKFGGVKQ